MKTKEVEVDGKKITVWKMNLGFRSDYQDDTIQTTVKSDGNRKERSVDLKNGRMILMTLVYGIYESTDLGIVPPKDLTMGFTPEEKAQRMKIIRMLEVDTEKIFEEIDKINSDVDEEVIKK